MPIILILAVVTVTILFSCLLHFVCVFFLLQFVALFFCLHTLNRLSGINGGDILTE